MYGRSGNDTVNGGLGNDKIFGENGEDILSGGQGDDLIVGDADLTGANLDSSVEDYLIGGGQGQDQLYIMGDDFAVGGGSNSFDSDFIFLLDEDPQFTDGMKSSQDERGKGSKLCSTILKAVKRSK
ncbi:MAG: hypothetical protein QNJ32_31395 [Xenococcaceae cyanobacterium MO_167.B27]|nr:hypothetical protein [Xenococcaceae cyanobacterium MO_167.B27]